MTDIITAPSPALSLIVNVDDAIKADRQLQQIVKKAMRPGVDYGLIPGTGNKPTLLKPGMEKLLMWYGLQLELPESRLSILDTDGYVSATVVSVIRHRRSGYVIAEGIGHANSGESRFQGRNRTPRGMLNNIIKMAKKRGAMDGTLTATASSGLFTQDQEEGLSDITDAPTDVSSNEQTQNVAASQPNIRTERQANGLTPSPSDANHAKIRATAEKNYRSIVDEADAAEVPAEMFDPAWSDAELMAKGRSLRAAITNKKAGSAATKAEDDF